MKNIYLYLDTRIPVFLKLEAVVYVVSKNCYSKIFAPFKTRIYINLIAVSFQNNHVGIIVCQTSRKFPGET